MVHAEREGGKAEGTGVDSGQVRSGIPARTASHTQLRRDSEIQDLGAYIQLICITLSIL